MLSLAKIGRGREDYHLRAAGADASLYYLEHGEVAGRDRVRFRAPGGIVGVTVVAVS